MWSQPNVILGGRGRGGQTQTQQTQQQRGVSVEGRSTGPFYRCTDSRQAQGSKMKYCSLLDLFILFTGRGRGRGGKREQQRGGQVDVGRGRGVSVEGRSSRIFYRCTDSRQAQASKMKYCASLDLFILLIGRGRGRGQTQQEEGGKDAVRGGREISVKGTGQFYTRTHSQNEIFYVLFFLIVCFIDRKGTWWTRWSGKGKRDCWKKIK